MRSSGQRVAKPHKLRMAQEARPSVVFSQHRYVRPHRDLSGALSKPNGPLERSQRTIDSGVRRLRFLAARYISRDAIGRELVGAAFLCEIVEQMRDRRLDALKAALVGDVFIFDHLRQVAQRRAIDVGTDWLSRLRVGEFLFQQTRGVGAIARLRVLANALAAHVVLNPPNRRGLHLASLLILPCRLINQPHPARLQSFSPSPDFTWPFSDSSVSAAATRSCKVHFHRERPHLGLK